MNTFRSHQLVYPGPALSLPGEEVVSCDCDARLYRQVLLETSSGLHACMKCGTVSYTEARGDDGRYTGQSCIAYVGIPLANDVMTWLAEWPRVVPIHHEPLWWMHPSLLRSGSIYLPAKLRCQTPEKLTGEEGQLHKAQQSLGRRATLMHCGFPETRPPAGLPGPLADFAAIWHDLQLSPQSDVQHLLDRANLDSIIAADLLIQRSDASAVMEEAIRNGKPGAALAMLRGSSNPPPDLTSLLIDALNAIPMTPRHDMRDRISQWHRMEVLLLIIAEHRFRSPAMSAALRALMRKVARHDATLVGQIRIALREIEQPSAATIAPSGRGTTLPS
jgi:hypothetical protein